MILYDLPTFHRFERVASSVQPRPPAAGRESATAALNRVRLMVRRVLVAGIRILAVFAITALAVMVFFSLPR